MEAGIHDSLEGGVAIVERGHVFPDPVESKDNNQSNDQCNLP